MLAAQFHRPLHRLCDDWPERGNKFRNEHDEVVRAHGLEVLGRVVETAVSASLPCQRCDDGFVDVAVDCRATLINDRYPRSLEQSSTHLRPRPLLPDI